MNDDEIVDHGGSEHYVAANTRSETSLQAYRAVEASGRLSRARWLVYVLLFKQGPLTRNEIDVRLKAPGVVNPTFSRRLVELERISLIHRPTKKMCSVTGHECDAWDVTGICPANLFMPKIKSKKEDKQQQPGGIAVDVALLQGWMSQWSETAVCPVPRKVLQRLLEALKQRG